MFVVVLSRIFSKNFRGMAIFPFIFLKDKSLVQNKIILNHERIHLRQQLEMFWILFFVWYGIEFLIRFIQYKNFHKAYFQISFEREAYANEKDLNYLKNRKLYSFIHYL